MENNNLIMNHHSLRERFPDFRKTQSVPIPLFSVLCHSSQSDQSLIFNKATWIRSRTTRQPGRRPKVHKSWFLFNSTIACPWKCMHLRYFFYWKKNIWSILLYTWERSRLIISKMELVWTHGCDTQITIWVSLILVSVITVMGAGGNCCVKSQQWR